MLMNDKIIFDRYCCYFKTVHDLGPVQIIIILHVLCVAPGNKDISKSRILTARAHKNSLINTQLLWQLIACSTNIYAII